MVLFPAISIDSGFIIQMSAHVWKREILSTTQLLVTGRYLIILSTENTQIWWKSVLSNKLSRIKKAKLISFLTENENLIKQPPDATSSSDSYLYFSPSPRPLTYGLRPST
ncbi:hypothetical protein AVEN_215508-1 [Araneus ventricosus]|uniref:Uncharacterized protein n=1 Tax=Araneus ventricosus TaxID=182803 RepID=A0A4Y2BG97_ARAVE|nr:hypothetical protein AVEN_215508-1 [Araneus ventricosus]